MSQSPNILCLIPSSPFLAMSSMNQDDFRKILATPRTTSGSNAPPLFTPSRTSKLNPFKKPPQRLRREGRSDVLEHSHVDLGSGFTDRAKERRLAELRGENEQSGEAKGLDFELLKKVRSGEFVLPKFEPPNPQRDDSDDEDLAEDKENLRLKEMELRRKWQEFYNYRHNQAFDPDFDPYPPPPPFIMHQLSCHDLLLLLIPHRTMPRRHLETLLSPSE